MDERRLLITIASRAAELCRCLSDAADTADATARLVQALENWHAWQQTGNEVSQPRLHSRVCKHCNTTRIFFAQDIVNGRWLPLELDPVAAEDVGVEWRWQVNVTTEPPTVTLDLKTPGGMIYLHHRWTCAMGTGPTKSHGSAYRRRYLANVARTEKDAAQAIKELRRLVRQFTQNDAEGD